MVDSMLQARASEPQGHLSRAEFDRLVATGAFDHQRVELVRGVLVEMAPIGPDHCDVVEVLNEVLMKALSGRARVRVQLAFAASDDSEPQPDMLIVSRAIPRGIHQHPSQALWAIEVADSSLRFDRSVKAALYAEAAIPEYWVFDVAHRQVEVYSLPVNGRYTAVTTHPSTEVLRPLAFPDVEVPLSTVFAFE